MIYLICYFAVGLLMMNVDKYGEKFNKILIFSAIAILTFLAAFRDPTIGADTGGYMLNSFYKAEEVKDWSSFISYHVNSAQEVGYRFLVLVCTKLFHSFVMVLRLIYWSIF